MIDEVKCNIYSADLLMAYEDAEGNVQQASPRTLEILRKLLAARPAKASMQAVIPAGGDIDLEQIIGKRLNFRRWQLCRNGETVLHGTQSSIGIPADFPTGDYLLEIDGPTAERIPVVITPRAAFQPRFARAGEKTWLLAVQLYALGSSENWGHGDFGDLMRILDIVAAVGGGGVGLNPLHALFQHNPEDASPYAPSSRLFLNPMYLDLAAVPGYAAVRPGDLIQDVDLVDYLTIAVKKYSALRDAYRRFEVSPDPELTQAFAEFRRSKGDLLRRFAAFNLLQERYGLNWREWPEDWQTPDDARIAMLARQEPAAIGFTEFTQWQCHVQLARCRDHAKAKEMPLGLYLDLAVGSHPHGFDAWNDQEAFFQGMTIGAPPDALNISGQNWGLTAFNPLVLIDRGFKPFRDILAAAMQYAGAIRIDHILGLNRFYLIPGGASGRDGAYLNYPLVDLLAVLAHESERWQCLVIGEDLGTVPEGFRQQLSAAGIWTYIVMLFERDEDGTFRAPARYPFNALATFSTHDLPPFAAWAEGRDLGTLGDLGLAASETIAQRLQAYSFLMDAVRAVEPGLAGPPFERMVAFLGTAGSAIVAVSLEEMLGQTRQINLPGTYTEYPNWRHRTWVKWPEFQRKAGAIAALLAKTGRQ